MRRTFALTALLDHSSEQCLRAIEADACMHDCQPRSDRGNVAILGLLSSYAKQSSNGSVEYNYTSAEEKVPIKECT